MPARSPLDILSDRRRLPAFRSMDDYIKKITGSSNVHGAGGEKRDRLKQRLLIMSINALVKSAPAINGEESHKKRSVFDCP